ncbi:hypothetical protein ACFOFO_03090 [Undibacterium arcticum]|uniref:Uncharacterized protein n=1 Tax=Undibacterium arcticum TaxID=1762892 RepID=A0ABV7EZF2_9BURK
MTLSYFFEDLKKSYQVELEDLQNDSEGNNVLAARLRDKRSQFPLLMPMIDSAPEMVAVAFHGGVTFLNLQAMYLLSTTEPDEFPAWDDLAHAVHFEASTKKLAETALKERGGERFLITAVCLEYLHGKPVINYGDARDDDTHDPAESEPGDDEEEQDLEEAGADWLAEQGFDRRG